MMDLHNHSVWSDGVNTIEDIVKNAVKFRIKTVGITDHLQTAKCPSVKLEQLDEYMNEVQQLKQTYKRKLKVLTGIEINPLPYPSSFESLPYEKLSKMDYVLIEYLEHMNSSINLLYLEGYLKRFSCRVGLAHTNLIRLAENHGGIDRVIKFLVRNDLFWEVNIGYEYSDEIIFDRNSDRINRLLNLIKDNKIEVSIGSDTHDIKDFQFGRLSQANKLIDDLGITAVNF